MKYVHDIMSSVVQSVSPDASLRDAVNIMSQFQLGCLPVMQNKRILGVLTEHDLFTHALVLGRDLENTRVSEAMSLANSTCYDFEEIEDALERMEDKGIHRLYVLNPQEQVIGEITSDAIEEEQEAEDWVHDQGEESDLRLSELLLSSLPSQQMNFLKKRRLILRVIFSFSLGVLLWKILEPKFRSAHYSF